MLNVEQARALAEKEIPAIRKDFAKEDITLFEGDGNADGPSLTKPSSSGVPAISETDCWAMDQYS